MNFWAGLLLFLFVRSATSVDYCRKDLCKNGKAHIGCGNYGAWNTLHCGSNYHLITLTPEDKKFILHLHNTNRQDIANGLIPGYQQAANMRELVWNDELALLASFNVKTCIFAHDGCRNTDNHPSSGQNLAIIGRSQGFPTLQEAYKEMHDKWFLEHKQCDMRRIMKFESRPGPQIGHFTQIVSDKTKEVGCAIAKYFKNGYYYVHIACNYSYSNMLEQPIYATGAPKCSVFSTNYRNLCKS